MRNDVQAYVAEVYPGSQLDLDYSLVRPVHIRFELGGKFKNGTQERVDQATRRALVLFRETFDNLEEEIWVLIYEYSGENLWGATNEYLHQQFPKPIFEQFYNQLEFVNCGNSTIVEDGEEVVEKEEVRVIIGKLKIKYILVENILNAIANTEMGFDPSINKSDFFFDANTDRAFDM